MSTVTGFRISPQQAAWWQYNQDQQHLPQINWLQAEIKQPLDEKTLKERLQCLTEREEILRTRLHSLPGMALPVQVIEDQASVSLDVVDCRNISGEQQAILLQELRSRTVQDSPLHVTLIKQDERRNSLLIKAPSSHLDLTSLELIVLELVGEPAPEERLQYADYAEWKYSLIEDESDSPGAKFWQRQAPQPIGIILPGLEAPTALSAESAAPGPAAISELNRGSLDLHIDQARLARAASHSNVGNDEILFAAWSVLIARLRGETQVQLVWIDRGRGEGLDEALGVYEQALPVTADVELSQTLPQQIETLLKQKRIAQGWIDYYDNAQKGNLSFAYRRLAANEDVLHIDQACSPNNDFRLSLDCLDIDGNLRCSLAYDRATFSEKAIAVLAEQWRLLLEGIFEKDSKLGEIHLQGEQQAPLLQSDESAPAIEPYSIVALIEKQAQRHPAAPALTDKSAILTYAELSTQSNQLGHYLVASGIRAGDVVGILLPRGNSAIVAMLAVLKAGGTYLPLDPSYPVDRLEYMAKDSGLRFLLSISQYSHLLADAPQRLLLDELNELAPELALQPNTSLPAITNLQQPAYLIYTSGSTGQPKAVEINHGNLSHSTQVRMAFYDEPVKAYLLVSSFAFDSSVAGIYWTLAQGGLLVLPDDGQELDLAVLTGLIERHSVSHSLSLPSLYDTLLDFANDTSLASLRTWIVAGEPCSPQVLAKHRSKLPNARLVNEYGPTEATVWATAEVLTDGNDREISIGRAIPTMQLYLLNEQGTPAALGEPGEIHLGGPTLSAGYKGRPEQTAKAFASYSNIGHGERLYKTGDLARFRIDGRLSFLGRTDHQVKIRGFRVELGEIERQLKEHSEVRDAAVVAQEKAGGKQLVAYITSRHGYSADAQALTDFLSSRLPNYMVPSAFVHVKEFPRTPNGKLNTKALPDPDQASAHAAGDFVAPRTELEGKLAAICAEVLRLDRVSITDNFFQIGGDSILSLQIVARANKQGIHITARQVFESETVARMAEVATIEARPAAEEAPQRSRARDASAPATAEDFPLADLDANAFEDLLTELNDAD